MDKSKVKFITKEKQDEIRRFFNSTQNIRYKSPTSPAIEFDADFSRKLQEKRLQQNKSVLNQKLMECSGVDSAARQLEPIKETGRVSVNESLEKSEMFYVNSENDDIFLEHERKCNLDETQQLQKDSQIDTTLLSVEPPPELSARQLETIKKTNRVIVNESLERSVIFHRNVDSENDDSFLEHERQCNLDDIQQRLRDALADTTVLSDIEPPPELWNQSVLVPTATLNIPIDEQSLQLSPVKLIGLLRQSTIIEETSSQCISIEDNKSTTSVSSTSNTSVLSSSSSSNGSKATTKKSPIEIKFRKRNYKFFSDECSTKSSISNIKKEASSQRISTEDNTSNLINNERTTSVSSTSNTSVLSSSSGSTGSKATTTISPVEIKLEKRNYKFFTDATPEKLGDQSINLIELDDTIDEMEFFMERGKRLYQQTPIHNKNSKQILETPLFSCKRSRILSEMAAIEMLPISKRGPLFNLTPSPVGTGCPRQTKQ